MKKAKRRQWYVVDIISGGLYYCRTKEIAKQVSGGREVTKVSEIRDSDVILVKKDALYLLRQSQNEKLTLSERKMFARDLRSLIRGRTT